MAVTNESGERHEDTEQRLSRVVDRLFPGTMQAAASSSSRPTRTPSVGALQSLSPFVLGSSAESNNMEPVTLADCSTWNRNELLKRLGTFKSSSWFAKPKVADPVACARRGWVNVALDVIGCEFCGARLSFPIPPSWPKQQVDQAALQFSEKLATGHKPFCQWRDSVSPESLMEFPTTPFSELVRCYNERMESLSKLSALPRISPAAVQRMKLLKPTQLQHLLADGSIGETTDDEAVRALRDEYEAYIQSQKLVSLCGWSPRLLPYVVDSSEEQGLNTDRGPKVFLSPDKSKEVTKATDPASTVLVCDICNVRVGLWRFPTVNRSAASVTELLAAIRTSSKTNEAVQGQQEAEMPPREAEPMPETDQVPGPSVSDSLNAVMDLQLTIGGGPRPTRLADSAASFPAFIPVPGLLKQVETHQGEASTPAEKSNKKRAMVDEYYVGATGHRHKLRKQGAGCSSVNAVETSYQNKHENSAESVECSPQEVLSRELNCGGQLLPLHISSNDLEPLSQHRYYCPWIYSRKEGASGWQLTLDALSASTAPPQPKASNEESASPWKLDPLASLRKLLQPLKPAL